MIEGKKEKLELVDSDDSTGEARDPLVGTVFAERYTFESVVGHGATGTVYKATDNEKHTRVAVKVMHGHLAGNSVLVERFKREAKTAATLDHPNVVSVLKQAVSKSGAPYIVMEYVDGVSLQEALTRDGWLPFDKALAVFRQLCAALLVAHSKGIVHRDLKPENIILASAPDGTLLVKVLDFGCAQAAPVLGDTVLRLTQTGEMLGSLLYMSPEQCLDQDVDERSDIYSMGCLMYETVTGTPPLSARTAFETMNKQITEMPQPLSRLRPELRFPKGLQDVIFKAMAKSPKLRYQNAGELMDALDKLAAVTETEPAEKKQEESEPEDNEPNIALFEPESDSQFGQAELAEKQPAKLAMQQLGILNVLPVTFLVMVLSVGSGHALEGISTYLLSLAVVFGYIVVRAFLRSRAATGLSTSNSRRARIDDSGIPDGNFYVATLDAIRNCENRVKVSIMEAKRQGESSIILNIAQTTQLKSLKKNRLLIQSAKNSDLFWDELCAGNELYGPGLGLPLSAVVVMDSTDRIVAVIVGPHIGWVVDSFLIQ